MRVVVFPILLVAVFNVSAPWLRAQSSDMWRSCAPGLKAYSDRYLSFCYPTGWRELSSRNPLVREEIVFGPQGHAAQGRDGDVATSGGIILMYLDKRQVYMNVGSETFVRRVLEKTTTAAFRAAVFKSSLKDTSYDTLGGLEGVGVFDGGTKLTIVEASDTIAMFWRILPPGPDRPEIGSQFEAAAKSVTFSKFAAPPTRPVNAVPSVTAAPAAGESVASLLGRWRSRTFSGGTAYEAYYTFNANGSFVYRAFGTQTGRYTRNGNELRLMYPRLTQRCECEVTGNTMTLLCASGEQSPSMKDSSFVFCKNRFPFGSRLRRNIQFSRDNNSIHA